TITLSYRALLAVSEAIVSHRNFAALFHELAGHLRQVVCFDYLALFLHDAANDTTRLHLLEGGPSPERFPPLSVEDTPSGMVLQTQEPLIVSGLDQLAHWPLALEREAALGAHSACYLPLTTARRRLGVLALGSRRAGAYDAADLDFLRQVVNQVAVAVE